MSFKLVNGGNDQSGATVRVAKTAETAMAKGDVVAWDIANNAVERATSSTTVLTLFGVCMEARVAGDTDVLVQPINGSQIWEADTANNTHATDQTGERCALTDHDTLNNSGTDVSTHGGAAVARIIAPVGAVADKKALVMFFAPQVVTS